MQQKLISKIISLPTVYARFLNTLSLMEYVGARKILKSQQYHYVTGQLLAHINEEIRHAQLLKRAAIKIEPTLCATYAPDALLCGHAAHQYFQTVDSAATTELNEQNSWHCYLYTTFLIEIRALEFYTLFESTLNALGKASVFRGILVEEQKHLQEVEDYLRKIPNYEHNIQLLKSIEEQAFARLLTAIDETIKAETVDLANKF